MGKVTREKKSKMVDTSKNIMEVERIMLNHVDELGYINISFMIII